MRYFVQSQPISQSYSPRSNLLFGDRCGNVSDPSGQNPEVLLDPTDDRLIIFPLKDDDIWNAYKLQESSFWTVEEINISCDTYDWDNKLSDSEHTLFSMILAFFASADSIVAENILQQEFPCVATKTNWALKWIQSSVSFPQRLIAFAAVEGVFFSEILPGLCFSNELICCNEGIHTDFACLLYSKLKNQLPVSVLTAILTEACAIEKQFWKYRLLQSLGAPKAYNVTNPFPFMEMISLRSKTNFFEWRNAEYSLPNFSERGAHHRKL
ncbi:putative small subunit of ribonucleotide reductase [Armillaria luteobubalina]|uniref:Small subunit of ribonucleotide reductase n=1 Tax=Armillaria luteobubalina TaxID=153913 RepID=A0AA39PI79_9AGAR|nr:putative small subunit of ribonucleotide reductase [Armillaria luteobubalina]